MELNTRLRGGAALLAAVVVWGGAIAPAVGQAEIAERETAASDRAAQVEQDLRHARSLSRAFQHAAELVEPSVVHITTRSSRIAWDMFGRRVRQQASGLGSGVVVSEDGYILTNNHVVQGATELVVRLNDGREIPAELVGGDELRDIAVLKVEATGLTPAALGSSMGLEVGQWVLALGSPFGFDQTVTAGIVSAKGRGLGIVSDEFKDAEQFIQTDAAINPGNSGGPLINLEGEVVGINSAIFSRTGGSVGLGFSIPIELAEAVYTNITTGGRVDFGYLGIEIDSSGDVVRVGNVMEDSPASEAGLQTGDVIAAYQGRPIANGTQLLRSIQFTPPGSQATVRVVRDGRPLEVPVTIESRSDAEIEMMGGRRIRSLGLAAATATERVLGIGTEEEPLGVYVLSVDDESLAGRVGIRRGDIILSIDGERVRSVDETVAALAQAGPRVRIDLQRGDALGHTFIDRSEDGGRGAGRSRR